MVARAGTCQCPARYIEWAGCLRSFGSSGARPCCARYGLSGGDSLPTRSYSTAPVIRTVANCAREGARDDDEAVDFGCIAVAARGKRAGGAICAMLRAAGRRHSFHLSVRLNQHINVRPLGLVAREMRCWSAISRSCRSIFTSRPPGPAYRSGCSLFGAEGEDADLVELDGRTKSSSPANSFRFHRAGR